MGVIFTNTCKKQEDLCYEVIATRRMGYCVCATLELTRAIHFEMMAREDGLLGHCKAKIWMGNPRLESMLWDGW